MAALSIGKLSTAATIVQTQGTLNRHEFRVIGRSLLGDGALDGPILRPSAARPVYYPVAFGTSEVDQPENGINVFRPVYGPTTRPATA